MSALMATVNRERLLRKLAEGPGFLKELLAQVPESLYKQSRKPGKWTIHEHAVHLTMVDDVMVLRLEAFRTQAQPKIVPYVPSSDEESGQMLDMDLAGRLAYFEGARARLLEAFGALAEADWSKRADHPEYIEYTPEIMLRHLAMHDQLHCYRIEELWLTRDEFLK